MEKFVFNFKKFPDLLKTYKKYRELELTATKYSMKDSAKSLKKYEEAAKTRDEFGYNVLAKEIFDTFSSIKPTLHKRRGEGGYFSWDEIFSSNFDDTDEKQRKCLIGLIYRLFVYELPNEYYVD